ncbi:PAS domain-containing protein [Undibacterium jejuense]|uniref:PAS domain-containing protein n=1 Tax=Undibacterium jejuense TaxID=1344949 RepID=A0A923KIH3_9BURK|nr:PAS domain-containing protein [Undibacterium jejuense]MBC3862662.1 PAS domain-containing protein [Undibacterium jejuense]
MESSISSTIDFTHSDNGKELLMRELAKVAEAVAKTLEPFCEVVLHDLSATPPKIVSIHGAISERKVNDSTTEMGYARINNPDFPDVVLNYPNTLPNGRPTKSTSIGIRDNNGQCIASLCLNVEIAELSSLHLMLGKLCQTDTEAAPVKESLVARKHSLDELDAAAHAFAKQYSRLPHDLDISTRKNLILDMAKIGYLGLHGSVPRLAKLLNVSRATIYAALKSSQT